MSQPFIGEIRIFAGNFPPAGWAFCNGATLSIAENEALYALIGITYGGDGMTTFKLPDLQGRSPVHMGAQPGGSIHTIGQSGGVEQVTLTTAQLPSHTHQATSAAHATGTSPSGTRWAAQATNGYSDGSTASNLAADALRPAGGSQPHENMPPYLAVSYIISLYGIFPAQG